MDIRQLSGVQIDEYELKHIIGEGGMSAVYRAYQEELDRYVAMKLLSDKLVQDPSYIKRFQQEARLAASLEHPHIVPVYDFGVYEEVSYVVMRLLGKNLSQRLNAPTMMNVNDVLVMLEQISKALDYAHSRGIIHRDLKPSNIMFDDSNTAYLVDFGIAKALQSDSGLTMENMVMGTPSYMSPEQWRGEGVGAASDQYGLAVVIYQVLTGRLPFMAESPSQWMYKHLNETAPRATELNPSLPTAVADVLARAMHKDAKRRFPLVSNFSNALTQALTQPDAKDTQERQAVSSSKAETALRQPAIPSVQNAEPAYKVSMPIAPPSQAIQRQRQAPHLMPQKRRKGKFNPNTVILQVAGGGLIGLILIFVMILIVAGLAYYFFGT